MPKRLNLIEEKFGNLTVVSFYDVTLLQGKVKVSRWNCLCECGNAHIAVGQDLKAGKVKSCGCLRKKNCSQLGKKRKKHCSQEKKNSQDYSNAKKQRNEEIVCLKKQGIPNYEIAKMFNISRQRVHEILKNMDYNTKPEYIFLKTTLSWLVSIRFQLETEEIVQIIKILNFFFPSAKFEEFYNPINNEYKNPDKIILDAFLGLF